MGVPDADAVPERPHLRGIGDLAPHFFNHETCPRVVGREDVLERADVVPLSATPGDGAQVEPVVDTEIREWRQILLVDCVPEPQLGGNPAIEVAEDVEAVCPFGCRRQPKQLDRVMCSRSAL